MLRVANAIWKDGAYTGKGTITTASGVLTNSVYSFGSLAGLTTCTSPGEMLAAAISSSMSRMVAVEMARVGIRPSQVETDTALTLDFVGEMVRIVGAQLKITARSGDSDRGQFGEAVESARRECPVSSILNIDIQCEAKLVSAAVPAFV
jgi:osmotically inducible protein OsmC